MSIELLTALRNVNLPIKPTYFYAIETAVTDLHWEGGSDDLKKEYFARLPELLSKAGVPDKFIQEAPRGGDQRMVDADVFNKTIDIFREDKGWDGIGSKEELREEAKRIVFGTPTLHAGGSTANTAHALFKSTINGHRIFEGKFETAVGDDEAGEGFEKSFGVRHSVCHKIKNAKTMLCHVIPIDGDRILITTPHGKKEAQNHISPDMITAEKVCMADQIMIGGFINFTPNGFGIYDQLAHYARQTDKNPVFVLTAANQGVVDDGQRHVRQKIRELQREFNTHLIANTGEFRRFLETDGTWRHRTEHRFAGLSGHTLEDAKKADSDYQSDKMHANFDAFKHAMEMGLYTQLQHNVTTSAFITNGSKASYLVEPTEKTEVKTLPVNGKIISTVGAGDASAAGNLMGKALGLDSQNRLRLSHAFGGAAIQTALARLDDTTEFEYKGRTYGGALGHALSLIVK